MSADWKNCIVFDRLPPAVLAPGLLDVLAASEMKDVSLVASLVLLLLLCTDGLGKGVMYCAPSGGQSLLLLMPPSLLDRKRYEADGNRESSLYGCCHGIIDGLPLPTLRLGDDSKLRLSVGLLVDDDKRCCCCCGVPSSPCSMFDDVSRETGWGASDMRTAVGVAMLERGRPVEVLYWMPERRCSSPPSLFLLSAAVRVNLLRFLKSIHSLLPELCFDRQHPTGVALLGQTVPSQQSEHCSQSCGVEGDVAGCPIE